MSEYGIGTPGTPWGEEEKAQWKAQQNIVRSYKDEVLSKLINVPSGYSLHQYGALPYDESRYPLNAIVPDTMLDNVPNILVTGGVHGYETSGVQGALKFINQTLSEYEDKANVIVVPCVSPWGYETINRWNPMAMDPNRSFHEDSQAPESALLMAFVASLGITFDMHIDLHETTDTDNTEFRPALAARDGVTHDIWNIPDGFYLVADTPKPVMAFQKAIIDKVRTVTHIAPPDENGKIIGADVEIEGVICYDKSSLHLCGGMTGAAYVSTTEVYPDSENATPENCNDAQVAAVTAAIDYVCEHF